ncbi:hypothetical protein X943_002742 [Babesia divergens]|uniref:Uncharacterized protein n=1 Tax=Babesia divergens TaxID=32595 RepID=A0AAD9LH69_BABDI|nr:hypothetical protein X943_002742 [Babesia divergens]
MDRAVLARCLKGIEASFSSNEARADALEFGRRQLNIVINAATALCKIDPHDSAGVSPEHLDCFVGHSKRILNETSRYVSLRGSNGSLSNAKYRAGHLPRDSACVIRLKLCRMRNKAVISFILAMCSHNMLAHESAYVQQLLSQLDLRDLKVSSLVALIGSLHKSELFTDSRTSALTEAMYDHLLSTSWLLRRLTSRECSLLLWRRLAMVYMGVPFGDIQVKQLRLLLYQCYYKVNDEMKCDFASQSHNVNSFLEGGCTAGSVCMTEPHQSQPPENLPLMRLQQTLSNISQAAIIMRHLDCASMSHGFLGHLSLSSLVRLHRMLILSQFVGTSASGTTVSSDTHTKVALAIRDATDQRQTQCFYEQRVGLSSYQVDILLTTK